MFSIERPPIFRAAIVAAVLGTGTTSAAIGQAVKPVQSASIPDPNILRIQEALVWTGYYEGPIDGSTGAGTQGAIKRFQHDIGKTETGTLDDAQAGVLVQRAQVFIVQTGYRQLLDARSGIRMGVPLGLASQRKSFAGGSDYASADGQMQIGLRVFRTGKDVAALFSELKSRLEGSSTTSYSVGRNTWFVLAGESESKKYYLRYTAGPDLIAGFFSVHDKSLPRETTGPYVAAVTVMSLTMQTFTTDLSKEPIPPLTDIGQLEPAALSSAGAPTQQAQPSGPAQSNQPVSPANDATAQALQKKVAELEAKQRQLERQLAAKTSDPPAKPAPPQRADASSGPTSQRPSETTAPVPPRSDVPTKPASSGSKIDYSMIVALATACVLLLIYWRRRSSVAASATDAKPTVALAAHETLPTVAPQEVPAPLAPANAPAAATVPASTVTAGSPASAAPTSGAGFNAILVGGSMVLVVFLLAFVVSKIAALAGFS